MHTILVKMDGMNLMITGIDLSEKNGRVDWSQLGSSGVDFAYLKATEALDIVDSAYRENLKNAKIHGILAGAYHWLHPELHVGQQADLFIQTVRTFTGMLRPVVCLEMYHDSRGETEKNVRAFLALIERKIGIKPAIYTSDTYWKAYMPKADWGCDYPLWLDRPGTIWPPQIWPWAGWTFWQYAYQTSLPGIPANLGLNRL